MQIGIRPISNLIELGVVEGGSFTLRLYNKKKCNSSIFDLFLNFSLGGLTLVLNVNSHAYLSPSRPQIGLIVRFEFETKKKALKKIYYFR